jgi:quinol monooxygenase YgiN
MFVIAATFKIKAESIGAFKELIEWQAERSVAEEDGCLQFDVSQDEEDPATFLLYEIYADAAAFDDHHIVLPRFQEFLAKAEAMNAADPVVKRMTRIFDNRK